MVILELYDLYFIVTAAMRFCMHAAPVAQIT